MYYRCPCRYALKLCTTICREASYFLEVLAQHRIQQRHPTIAAPSPWAVGFGDRTNTQWIHLDHYIFKITQILCWSYRFILLFLSVTPQRLVCKNCPLRRRGWGWLVDDTKIVCVWCVIATLSSKYTFCVFCVLRA